MILKIDFRYKLLKPNKDPMNEKCHFLQNFVDSHLFTDYPLRSRIHPLKSYNTDDLQCYIKRDDELGLMGSKIRKFSSLISYLIHNQIQKAVVIGGLNSNHVLGITQLLIENRISPQLFLCESHQPIEKGNALLTRQLIEAEQIHWIPRSQWSQINELAEEYAKEQKEKTFVIPEGGCCFEAFPGALTLALDIVRNEHILGASFNHLFIDSGTGLTAIALLLGLAFLKHPAHLHIVLMAGNETEFRHKLEQYHQNFQYLMKTPIPYPIDFSLQRPHKMKSFGSVSPSLFKTIQQIARSEGVFCDPIYNAKLFQEAARIIQEKQLHGRSLIIQSGGTLSLLGFLTP
ncbi:MAG: pyridoxal-phosphate dependent enzyme [Chlamydiales bacterium]|mgnify:CR=1 FL=1|nr:pyridoxal-phosphate dependent enzyme [Chlamydiales bacterium]